MSRFVVVLLAFSACGAKNDRAAVSDPPASSTSAPSSPPPAAPRSAAMALLTIRFVPTAACSGGQFFVDGVANGTYPINRHPVPPGRHRIHIASAGDCGGYGDLELEFSPGRETELEPSRFR